LTHYLGHALSGSTEAQYFERCLKGKTNSRKIICRMCHKWLWTSVHSLQVVKGFRLKLQVADMSGMGLTSLANAVIHVTDINNNPPRFSPDQVSLTV
jgi:hypothetical protein